MITPWHINDGDPLLDIRDKLNSLEELTGVTSGTSGTSGKNGDAGTSGTSGKDGDTGTSGTSGKDGDAGTSGISGKDGDAGTAGSSGRSDSGTSGSSGTSGIDGSGTSGTSGENGTSGTSGENATSGTSGTSGENGTSGTSGTSGENGTSGTSGTSGESGTSGTSGESGTSGTSGESGTSGSSGTSATAGTSGNSGSSGTSGNNNVENGTSVDQLLRWDGSSEWKHSIFTLLTETPTDIHTGITATFGNSYWMYDQLGYIQELWISNGEPDYDNLVSYLYSKRDTKAQTAQIGLYLSDGGPMTQYTVIEGKSGANAGTQDIYLPILTSTNNSVVMVSGGTGGRLYTGATFSITGGQNNYIVKYRDENTITGTTTPMIEYNNKIGIGYSNNTSQINQLLSINGKLSVSGMTEYSVDIAASRDGYVIWKSSDSTFYVQANSMFILQTTTQLDSTDVGSLYSTPIDLLSKSGASKYWKIYGVEIIINVATQLTSGSQQKLVVYSESNGVSNYLYFIDIPASIPAGTYYVYMSPNPGTSLSTSPTFTLDDKIKIALNTGNFTGGSASMDVYYSYSSVTI